MTKQLHLDILQPWGWASTGLRSQDRFLYISVIIEGTKYDFLSWKDYFSQPSSGIQAGHHDHHDRRED